MSSRSLSWPRFSLELVLGICAILISAASFYATYLQAASAEKQVKAMTLPLMSFRHGNFDEEANLYKLSFSLVNAGMGPALIRDLAFRYQGQDYRSLMQLAQAISPKGVEAYLASEEAKAGRLEAVAQGALMSRPVVGNVVPGQDTLVFFELYRHDINEGIYQALEQARWQVELKLCYCSLLDECYQYAAAASPRPVAQCPAI